MILDFTQTAAADLMAISEFTRSTWGDEQEERYLKQLYGKFHQMIADPAR